ncbi:hypothetical protein [Saccharopolyspora sp. NPDC002376]
MVEVVHEGIRHRGKVSLWNGHAHSLCGKTFADKTFKEPLIFSGLTCDDCKSAKKAGKKF